MIPFNRPPVTGQELERIRDAISRGKTSGNGYYTQYCQFAIISQLGGGKALLTHSGTGALDMAAILLEIGANDEVIVPSFSFSSTANAFVLRGARLVFADSMSEHPNMDAATLRGLITPRTRCIVVVHYAGMACDMPAIMALAEEFNLFVVEDCAQAFGSSLNGKALGTFGHLAAFSFHETKTIACGEGGCLVVNDPSFFARAEIIWEKGTNRAAFSRGEVSKYEWIDVGSSFLMSEIQAAWLSAQLDQTDIILEDRLKTFNTYKGLLNNENWGDLLETPVSLHGANHNASIFYLRLKSGDLRDDLMHFLQKEEILAVFHYLPLHLSPYFKETGISADLPNAVEWSERILRLPLFFGIQEQEIRFVTQKMTEWRTRIIH